MSMYIPSFAIIHAKESNRDHLKSADVLAGVYVYSSDCFSSLGDLQVLIPTVRRICDFSEPLWIIQSRYFANLHPGPEGLGPQVNVPEHLKSFFDSPSIATLTGEKSAALLLEKLLEVDVTLKSKLACGS